MEPKKQVEIQLGHLCNNRCVFCVSGQRTAMGMARPLPAEPILAQLRQAYAAGHRKVTLLGGEPTLQPAFLEVVREAVALGFEEIVIFSNGVRTAREEFVDQILATGGNFTFRFSLQGATQESHERTTRRPGSFARLLRSMEHVAKTGRKITVNMCVVQSNYESVVHFPSLLLPFGVAQLHLDMMRPLDAGERTEEELRATIPRYSDLVGPLERMVRGFPAGFDVNIGNLPYCIAPHLAPWIHHDGETTLTVSVEGDRTLSEPWDKYATKRRDKLKRETCTACVFYEGCSGVFETYARFYGTAELVPVTPERLRAADPELKMFPLHVRSALRRIDGWRPPPPYDGLALGAPGADEVPVHFTGPDPLLLALRRPREGVASFDLFSLLVRSAPGDPAAALGALRAFWSRLAEAGLRPLCPVGDDAVRPVAPSLGARLVALRRHAPFGDLDWVDTVASRRGDRVEVCLRSPAGETVVLWLEDRAGRAAGGYRLESGDATRPSPALVEGLRAALSALGRPLARAGGAAA